VELEKLLSFDDDRDPLRTLGPDSRSRTIVESDRPPSSNALNAAILESKFPFSQYEDLQKVGGNHSVAGCGPPTRKMCCH